MENGGLRPTSSSAVGLRWSSSCLCLVKPWSCATGRVSGQLSQDFWFFVSFYLYLCWSGDADDGLQPSSTEARGLELRAKFTAIACSRCVAMKMREITNKWRGRKQMNLFPRNTQEKSCFEPQAELRATPT